MKIKAKLKKHSHIKEINEIIYKFVFKLFGLDLKKLG